MKEFGKDHKELKYFAFFYFSIFMSAGVHNTFFPYWLYSNGLNITQVSIVLSMPLAIKMVADPFWSAVADETSKQKNIILFLTAATAISYSLYFFVYSYYSIIIVALLCGFFWSSVMPISDSVISMHTNITKKRFGFMRMFGSLSVLVMALVSGLLVSLTDNIAITLLILSFSVTFFSIYFLFRNVSDGGNGEVNSLYDIELNKITPSVASVLMIGLAASLCLGSHSIIYTVGTLYWMELGFSNIEIGWLWAAALLSEILVFIVTDIRRLTQVSPILLIFVGSIIGVLRWTGISIVDSYIGILILQMFQGGSLALVVVGIMRYSQVNVLSAFRSRFFGKLAAISHGAIPLIVTMLSGVLYKYYSNLAILVGALLCGVSIVLSSAVYLSIRKEKNSLHEVFEKI